MKLMRAAVLTSALLCAGTALANTCTPILAGSTDQSVFIEFIDSTTGVPTAGLAFNSSGIDLEYVRTGAAAVDITEATQTANGAHSDGGFVSVGHGRYRLDLPDAAVATTAREVIVQGVITGYIMLPCTVQLNTSVAQTGDSYARIGSNGAGLSAVPWNASWDAEVESEVDDSIGGGTGTALTAIPWNASWDAEVQSEAADAINADTGDSFTAIPWNASWDAEVQSEANDALVVLHLDHLLAVSWDPSSEPVADALLAELTENDGGVARFTANSLEQAPSGGGCIAAGGCSASGTLAGTHTSSTADLGTNAPGAASDLVGKTLDIPAKFFSRVITAYNTTTGVATFDATSVTLEDSDAWYLWDTAPGGALGTGSEFTAIPWNSAWDAEVESEVDDALGGGGTGTSLTALPWNNAWEAEIESEVDDALGGGTGTSLTNIPWNAAWDAEVQSEAADAINADTGDSFTAVPWNAAWDAEAQSEATDALNAYDPPTRAELTTDTNSVLSAVDAVPTAAENVTAIEGSTALPVAKYTNADGDVCTFIISDATPKVTFSCVEAP